MKVKVVESIPSRRGANNKYLPLLKSFANDFETGTCAVFEDVVPERAAYLKTIRCSHELPVNIVTRDGAIYLERVASFGDVK